MQLLTVVLGRPGTIGFATGLAHPRARNLLGKQGWYTGQGIIAWDLTHGNYGSTTWTDSFVDSLLGIGNRRTGTTIGSGGCVNIVEKYMKAKAYCVQPFEVMHH